MNDILKFGYENGETLECVELNGEPLFEPRSIGNCLGLSNNSVSVYLSEMDSKDKVFIEKKDEISNELRNLPSGGKTFLRESGMYLMIFKSRKKEAKSFKKWVARKVLPQIRKTGKYGFELENQNVLTRQLLDNMTRNLEQLTGVMAAELAITQHESWNKRLSNLMIDCSTRGLGSTPQLYDELFYVFASETDIYIPEIAELKGLKRMDYLRQNKSLCKTLYEFAHEHFTSATRQVVLVPLDQNQQCLDTFGK